MNYAICNETFAGWEHPRVCEYVAALGYTGLEVAPFTLAPLITDVTAAKRTELRRDAEKAGVRLIGLHWLLAKTSGFQLTSPDPAVRQATAAYLAELARCAADLGGDILVLGSPAQRKVPDGHTRGDAARLAADTLTRCLPALEQADVMLCLEPLTPNETDFLNTAAEAVELMAHLGDHPNVKLHLDVKAMTAEPRTAGDTLREYAKWLYHVHANDPNMRGPGFGDTDFRPILAALKETGYRGWVSVEVFDYSPDPETIATASLRYLRGCEG